MGYGINIKHILKQNDMSIKVLAEKSGVSLNTLYNITKTDPFSIRQATLDKILPILGVSEKELANYDIVRLNLEDGTTESDTKKIMIDQVTRIMSETDNYGCVEIFKYAVQIQASEKYNLQQEKNLTELEE